MLSVEVKDAELTELLAGVRRGEEITLLDGGMAVARVVPVAQKPLDASFRLGLLEGQARIPANWKELGRKEIEEEFYGKE